MRHDYEELLRRARRERERVTAREEAPGALWLINALVLPVLAINLFPTLALYFLALAPAFPLIVLVLFVQMRHLWSRPEITVAFCTLIGFAIGYGLLFYQYYGAVAAKVRALLNAI